jgi:hypothetical protein
MKYTGSPDLGTRGWYGMTLEGVLLVHMIHEFVRSEVSLCAYGIWMIY